MKRITSIDFTRGLVMIIMALDHTRDLMHFSSTTQNPTNLATTTPAIFFTRWVTHLCAPTFVFLSGASAYLSVKRQNNFSASRNFLLTRGLWLFVVEFTLVNFGVWFDIHFQVSIFDVIATIGFGFIVLALLLKLSPKTIGIIGLVIIFCHNIYGMIPFANGSVINMILSPLFLPGAMPLSPNFTFVMGYPPIPWTGMMLIGFGAGHFFEMPEGKRKKLFLKIGLASLVLFIIIRSINVYGDSFRWATQKNSLYTFLSFINVTKYPPSLVFCLAMLGIMFIVLSFAEGLKGRFNDIAIVYGKVPLFYFIVHWYIIHPLMFAMVFLQGYKKSDMVFGFSFGRAPGSGLGLVGIYLVWIAVLIVMYPLCKWYGKYKSEHREKKWLRYL